MWKDMRNRFGRQKGLIVLCAVIICMLTVCTCAAEEIDYSIQGPYTWWDGMTIPDNEVCNELLGELYYHVGVWEDADGSGHTLMIENNSMTGLDYSLTAYFPARGTIEFNCLTVEPSGKYVIFYDENGENEAHVYLPYNSAPYAQFFSKNSSWQTEMGEWVYSYVWSSILPGAAERDPLNAWVEEWYCSDCDAELSIRHEGRDDGLHVLLTLVPGVDMEFNITDQHDYEILECYTDDGIYLYMFLNAYTMGKLELHLEADTATAQAFVDRTGVDPFNQEHWFWTEVPPDLTLYGWTPDLGENSEEMPRPAPERLTATENTPYAIYGPVTTWDGRHPEDQASYEALCEFSSYTGSYNGPDGTSVTFAERDLGSNKYMMRAYFPNLGTLELDYMTTGPDARYLIFYSVDGDFEAHVYYSFVSSPYIRYYWKGSDVAEQIGTGIYRYDNGKGLPAAYFSDWAELWTGNWAEIGGTSAIHITRNGNGTLHLHARFDPSLEIEDDFATDQYDCYFRIEHTTADGLEYSLFINEEDGGKLEFYPWTTGIDENSRYYLVLFHKQNGEIYPNQYAYKHNSDTPAADMQPAPDQTEDITIVIYRKLVFGILRSLKLQASSGAGAWEGTLEIDTQGRFTGEYTDSDDDQVYTVSFSGTFGEVRRVTASTYILTVTSAATEKTPGTEWNDEYGIHYVSEDTLLPEGSQWLLTLTGTELDDIPEMVQGEITGTYGDVADPRNFITLTDLRNGWGFFARVKEDKQEEQAAYPDRSNPFNGGLTPDTSDQTNGSGKDGTENTPTGGRTIRRGENYSEIWARLWFLNGDRNSTIDITLNENGTLHVVVHIYLILDFEFDVAPTDFEFLMFTDESGRIIGYLILGDDGTLYLYIDPDSPIMEDQTVSDYLRDHPLLYTANDPPVLQPDPEEPEDADAPEVGPSVPASDGTVILDDEYITVTWLDEGVSLPSREGGETWPYYRLAFTNKLDIDIIIHLGFAGGEGGWGTVDGIPLRDLLIYTLDGIIIGDNLVIPAGSSTELIFRPVGGGYGYRTAEELINVIIRFHLKFRNETRDYELPLNSGESPIRLPSNETIRYDAIRFGVSFRIPANWLVIDGKEMLRILPPPYLAGTLEDIIQITFGRDGMWEALDTSGEYIRQEGMMIGGRPADVWRSPTSVIVIIQLGSGTEVVIIIRWEEPFAESVRPVADDFLDSIEYTMPEGEDPVAEPEQPAEETQPGQPTEETQPEQPADVILPELPVEETQPGQPTEETQPEQPAEILLPEIPIYAPDVALEPINGRPGKYKVPVMSISASGYIVNANDSYMFIPEKMIDGIDETCWQFSTQEIRLGDAYIHISFSAPVDLDELWMKNGFWRITNGYDQYIRNCRIKKMEIDFRFEGSFSYTDGFAAQLNDDKARRDWTVISLGGKTCVTDVRIRIMDVYRGEKFKNDVAVSDIMFVQNEK